MVVARTSLAFSCAVSRASSSRRMAISCASRRDSTSSCARSCRFASSAVRPAIDSSLRRCSSSAWASRPSLSATAFSRPASSRSFALELIELARELFVLRQRALLDLLDLALALAGLGLGGGARLERGFLHLEVGALDAVGGVTLGVLDDALGPARRVPELPLADPLVQDEAEHEGEHCDDGVKDEPNALHCRSIGATARGSQIPASAVCRRCFEPGMHQVGAVN